MCLERKKETFEHNEQTIESRKAGNKKIVFEMKKLDSEWGGLKRKTRSAIYDILFVYLKTRKLYIPLECKIYYMYDIFEFFTHVKNHIYSFFLITYVMCFQL